MEAQDMHRVSRSISRSFRRARIEAQDMHRGSTGHASRGSTHLTQFPQSSDRDRANEVILSAYGGSAPRSQPVPAGSIRRVALADVTLRAFLKCL